MGTIDISGLSVATTTELNIITVPLASSVHKKKPLFIFFVGPAVLIDVDVLHYNEFDR